MLEFGWKDPIDRFAKWAIRSQKRAWHDLSTEVGTKSRTDVLEGWIRF